MGRAADPMVSCRNLDSMSRKPQCPVTCQGAVIRPPRPGAPSCGTRHLGSLRSVLAKQAGYQTSFLLSSAAGSCELSSASTAIARVQSTHNSYNPVVLHVCHELPAQKANDHRCLSPLCESALADKVMRCYGACG
jgi:hypothetical protein